MRHPWFACGAVLAAALSLGALQAEPESPRVEDAPPGSTRVDVAPLPAQERDSIGAVVLGDLPVLAQRESLRLAKERAAEGRQAPQKEKVQRVRGPAHQPDPARN